jgi:hypothetical protein
MKLLNMDYSREIVMDSRSVDCDKRERTWVEAR